MKVDWPVTAAARRVVLCADDYGMSVGISKAMIELAEAGKLSALSAMTNLPAWAHTSHDLPAVRKKVSVGLHLNLTTGSPLSGLKKCLPSGDFQSLQYTLLSVTSRRWQKNLLREEIMRQLDRFEEAVGAAPDHVDGHQHVHVFPLVRSTLLRCLAERYSSQQILFRIPAPSWRDVISVPNVRIKALIIKAISSGADRAARDLGMTVNDSFSGFSSFNTDESFEGELQHAMHSGEPFHLVMCHPGYVDDEIALYDPIVNRRQQEYLVIMNSPIERYIWQPKRDSTNGNILWSDVSARSIEYTQA